MVGCNALVVQDFERLVDVCGYDPAGPVTSSLRTVSAALAYTRPTDGEVIILVIHQAVLIPSLHHNLLCPNQMRLNDVVVHEQPKFLTERPTDTTHAIVIPGDDETNQPPLTIPLDLKGLVSCFPTRLPTAEEYESCLRYELTSESPVFEPHDTTYAQQEAACIDYRGFVKVTGDDDHGSKRQRRLCGVASTNDDSNATFGSSWDDHFVPALLGTVRVSSVKTGSSAPGIDAATLARNWGKRKGQSKQPRNEA